MRYFILFFLLCINCKSFSQNKYWIYFDSKHDTTYENAISITTLESRSKLNLPLNQLSDVPVSKFYIDYLRTGYNVSVINKSKWLNAITAYLTVQQLESISKLNFVIKIEKIKSRLILAGLTSDREDNYPLALKQMHAEEFLKRGFTGKGIVIGVIDGRFKNINNYPSIKHIVDGKQILGTRNFAQLNTKKFLEQEQNSKESHCPEVLKIIGGINEDSSPIGLAPDASFYLARTEISERELKQEEDYWIASLEWMDSLGVRLVNSSIGYALGFEDSGADHKLAEIDGKTTAITKAAQIAAEEKGMILVLAAGNEGNEIFWTTLTVPADAQNVITVGATDEKGLRQKYSSMGPLALSYIKPDISVFASNGTSFAAPVVTGLIACMLQKDPTLKIKQIQSILQKSGRLYPYGNNFIGYGVPDVNIILKLMDSKSISRDVKEIKVKGEYFDYKLPDGHKEVLIFHKINRVNVMKQEILIANTNNYVRIEKKTLNDKSKIDHSTIVLGTRITELTWQ